MTTQSFSPVPFTKMRARGVTPHVAQNTSGRSSAIDRRGPRHPRYYALSQRLRKRVKEVFSWTKTVGGFRGTRHRGLDRTGPAGYLVGTTHNLVRVARLMTSETSAPHAALAQLSAALDTRQGCRAKSGNRWL